MARWYQNVLTGEQVQVKTLDDDDYYVENKANWARIIAPMPATEEPVEEPAEEPVPVEAPKPATKKPAVKKAAR